MFKGQPKGLFALALANTGERFGYYTMLAIFTLYMRAKFGWDENAAGQVYAIFLIGFLGWKFNPYLAMQSLPSILIISFFTALTSIIGDLVESVIKRSANFKDSGRVIPGRGGLLDSIDSILFSAPPFFLLTELFFGL